ncbi:alpha/beta fold hydrolase [Spiractinospora alimapuensis]|uniref:alpha/beta fold hydrolase n=1 Tax=Spiractinospora alimapuensis TaxID=2820884 RepID=UPI0022AA3A21|nr:alpha/beta fold hydrolase [Spiractinospora alimapuensis]QVQ52780.1 alpha/beta fold hydrolase [Spiractinospora alimapuensis]
MSTGPHVVVFLHGMGASPQSWSHQVDHLSTGFTGLTPQVPGLGASDPPFSVAASAAGVRDILDEHGVERAHLCGLSLGAMVATRFAIDHPDRVASLVLSGGQVRPNPTLMRVQAAVMRLLPQRIVAPGMTKSTLMTVLRAVAAVDFRSELATITAPTLVLCGARDFANLPAARALAATIPDAEIRVIPRAGHELNVETPERFSAELNAFHARFRDDGADDATSEPDEHA